VDVAGVDRLAGAEGRRRRISTVDDEVQLPVADREPRAGKLERRPADFAKAQDPAIEAPRALEVGDRNADMMEKQGPALSSKSG
jgi:hypothetical protein